MQKHIQPSATAEAPKTGAAPIGSYSAGIAARKGEAAINSIDADIAKAEALRLASERAESIRRAAEKADRELQEYQARNKNCCGCGCD